MSVVLSPEDIKFIDDTLECDFMVLEIRKMGLTQGAVQYIVDVTGCNYELAYKIVELIFK